MTIWRGGKVLEKMVVPVALEDIKKKRAEIKAEDEVDLKSFGLRVGTDGQPGLVVTEVDPRGLAAQAGIEPGDRIMAERTAGNLKTSEDAKPLARRQEITIQVYKDGRAFWLRMRR